LDWTGRFNQFWADNRLIFKFVWTYCTVVRLNWIELKFTCGFGLYCFYSFVMLYYGWINWTKFHVPFLEHWKWLQHCRPHHILFWFVFMVYLCLCQYHSNFVISWFWIVAILEGNFSKDSHFQSIKWLEQFN
jgi:hypothetical protein